MLSERTETGADFVVHTRSRHFPRGYSSDRPSPALDAADGDGDAPLAPLARAARPDQRTIVLSNLSDRATYKDVTNILRGGRLLDVYIRSDRTAIVSFVEGAADFMAYAKKNDVYMHAKRVSRREGARASS